MMIKKYIGLLFLQIGFLSFAHADSVTLVTPTNKSVLADSSVMISWNKLQSINKYKLYIAEDSMFTINIDSFTVYSADTLLTSFTFGETYYWKVLADTGNILFGQSAVFSFTIFTPMNIVGLQLWLRSDSGIVQSGNDVSTWQDASGSGNDAQQLTGSLQPDYADSLSLLNYHGVVRFDGVDDYMDMPALSGLLSSDYSIFILYKFTDKGAGIENDRVLHIQDAGGTNAFQYNSDDASGETVLRVTQGGTDVVGSGGNGKGVGTRNEDQYEYLSFVMNAGLAAAYINGIPRSLVTTPFSGLAGSGSTIGRRLDGVGTSELKGDIVEIMMYDTSLTDSQRVLVEKYMRYKYVPPVNLGADLRIPYGFCDTILDASLRFVNYKWSTDTLNDTLKILTIDKTGTYSITVTDILGFTSSDSIKVIYPGNLKPFPDTTICPGDTITWDTKLDTIGYDFTWSTGDSSSSIQIYSAGQYYIRIDDTLGCWFYSDTITVTVDTFALIVTLGPDDTLCSGNYIELQQGASQTVSYLWSDSSTGSSLIIDTTGIYWVKVTNTIGCIAIDTISVTIIGIAPNTGFNANSVCIGDSTYFSNSSTATTPDTITSGWTWAFGDGDSSFIKVPVHKYQNPGLYSVSLTAITDSGCINTKTDTVAVYALTVADYSTTALSGGCVGISYLFLDSSIVAINDSITSWLWDFGNSDTSTDQNPVYIYTSDSIYSIRLTISTLNGCYDDTVRNISIVAADSLPLPFTLVYPSDKAVISDSINNFIWNYSFNATSYTLQFSTDSFLTVDTFYSNINANNQTVLGLLFSEKYYWRVIAYNLCHDSIISEIQTFTLFNPQELIGLSVWFRSDMGITSSNDTVTDWNDYSENGNNAYQVISSNRPIFIDNIPMLNYKPILRFDGLDDFLEVSDDTTIDFTTAMTIFIIAKQDSLAINETLIAKWDYNTQGCWVFQTDFSISSELRFYVADALTDLGVNRTVSTNADLTDTKFFILGVIYDSSQTNANRISFYKNTSKLNTFVDGTIVTFLQNSSATLKIGQWGGSLTRFYRGDIAEIIIYNTALNDSARGFVEDYLHYKYAPPVNIGLDIIIPYGFCDTTLDAGERFVNYQWSTDSTDTNQTLSVTQPGTYSVIVTDIFGFLSSDTINVYYPGNLKPFNDTTICLGDTIVWDTRLVTSLYSFFWQDGSSNPLLLINQAGSYYVEITDTNGCVYNSDTLNVIVDTFSLIASLGNDTTFCAGNYIELQQGASQTVSYLWLDSSTNSSLQVDTTGYYWVTVTDPIGCVATDTITVTIQDIAPNAVFTADAVCLGNSTIFTDSSFALDSASIISWFWDFGDDSTSTIQNPTHLYDSTGTYNVTLTVVTDSGCSANTVKAVDVHALPQANFSPVLGCSGADVFFTDLSSVPVGSLTGWEWDFGDPSSGADNFDTLKNPTHVFADSGSYLVKLKVFTNNGCVDSITQIVTIKLSPLAGFSYPPACDGEYVTFTDISITTFPWSITNWSWDFGDSSTSTLSNPIHLYGDTGLYIVSLIVQALDGCVDTVVDSVIVNPVPVANFIGNDLCINTPYQFIDSSYVPGGIIASWYWDFDGLGASGDQNPLFAFSDTGSFPVNLTVASSAGCTNSITNTVEVRDLPVTDFSFNPLFGPPPLTVIFTDQSNGAISYNWDFGDGSTSTSQNPTHLYVDTGIYTIQLIASDIYGCKDSVVKVIKVLRPFIDIAVIDVITDIQSNYLTISVNLSNMGTRDINSMELHAQINGGITIREDWMGTLQSGGNMTYDFNAGFVLPGNFDLQYVCVSALNPNNDNDDVPSNNEQCITFSDGFIALEPYPNPTDDEINIEYIIPYSEFVEVILYDAIGKRVSTLFSEKAQKGLNKILLNSASLNEGMYFYRINFIDRTEVKKFVVSK